MSEAVEQPIEENNTYEEAPERPQLDLDPTQQEAIRRCVDVSPNNRIVPITGQAGTGKTTIMRLVYQALTEAGHDVVLCAPTGKAAKRIQEATGIPAMTIHRLLEYPFPGERDEKSGKPLRPGFPKRDKFNPLGQNVVLCDEYAMVNHEVHRNLIDALPNGGCLRMFGDVNQLPPIEKGKLQEEPSVFTQSLEQFKGVRLERIHRQGEGSGIVTNGAKILRGQMPTRMDDFKLTITEGVVEALKKYVIEALDDGIDFSRIDCQVITPTKQKWTGSHKLNTLLQTIFRPETDGWLELPRHSWDEENPVRVHVGDKVIWTQNNYELEVFNGETGVITEISEYGEIVVDWGDRISAIPPVLMVVKKDGNEVPIDPRKDMDLAYAITTHKSQGSEYKHVAYIVYKSALFNCNKHNFYTAITRARESVHVFSDQRALFVSCQPPRIRPSR